MEIWLFCVAKFPSLTKNLNREEALPHGGEMKKLVQAISMMAIIIALSVVASAATMTIGFQSGDGTATSNTGNVFVIPPHPAWGSIPGAQWVSAYAGTGYGGGVVMPNSSVTPVMSFTQAFTLPYMVNGGVVTVGADDTASVWLNGTELKTPNFVLDNACSAGPIACEVGEFMTLNLTPYLIQGVNTLRIDVYQLGGDVTGTNWAGGATSSGAVPEPKTYALMGAGLAGLAFLRGRRKG